jgi:PAS domain S-box-containing protein
MTLPSLPSNDKQRVAALHKLRLLDSEDEERFDRLTRMSARMFNVPISYISLVDENRQWLKSCVGVGVRETARDISFCGHAILSKEPFIIPDATLDSRFSDNPLVTGPPHVRFYAGIPLATEDNFLVGTLCLVDQRPRTFAAEDVKLFQDVAVIARDEMNFRGSRQLAAIINSSDDAIISKTLDGIITTWNLGAEKVFGYSAEEAIGQPMLLLFPPERVVEEKDILAQIAQGKKVEHFETVRVRKDGKRIHISVTLSPIIDERGKVIGASKIARDISGRKEAEEELRESEGKFRLLAEHITDVLWITSPDLGTMHYVSPGYQQTWGRSTEDLYAHPHQWAEAIVPEDRERVLAVFGTLMRTAPNVSVEYRIARPDGTVRWIHDRGFQVRDDDGQLIRLTGIAADITDRKEAMGKIAEQAAFLDKARDAILVRDLEGKILFWNKGAEHIYGWASEEVVGRNIGGLLYTDLKKFEEANALTIRQGEWSGELHHLTKNRGELTVEARWTLIRDQEGRPKSVLAINTDITEKKKIEAQFMRAQRMESIGTLAGGIAHDLNNILAPIMMSIDILKTTSDNPQTKVILDTIEVSAKRGADIVRQVLSFARGLEGERIEIQPKHLLKDLESIIKDTFPKDIRLRFSVPNDIWTILGDPTQVHQVLLNLSVNARDAMPNGGNLIIGVENCELDEHYAAMNIQAKSGRYVQISVTDSGTGMPPELIDKIFEPFFTTKDLNKGTGLGLSTVMAIVKSHEGIINVYSEPGKGTTFKVYLPATDTSSGPKKGQAEELSLPRGKGETILVIDDEASILTITSQTLQAFGYRVLTAIDGADALSIYAQHRNDIAAVLTDMMMPILDGPATIYALMRMNPAVKIVAASGLNANGGVAKVTGTGVKHFLTKPYTAGTLLKTIRAILDET